MLPRPWRASCSPEVDATAADLTLDTAVDKRKRWQIVWRGARFSFAAETGAHVTMSALNPIFLGFTSFPSLFPLRSFSGVFLGSVSVRPGSE